MPKNLEEYIFFFYSKKTFEHWTKEGQAQSWIQIQYIAVLCVAPNKTDTDYLLRQPILRCCPAWNALYFDLITFGGDRQWRGRETEKEGLIETERQACWAAKGKNTCWTWKRRRGDNRGGVGWHETNLLVFCLQFISLWSSLNTFLYKFIWAERVPVKGSKTNFKRGLYDYGEIRAQILSLP